MPANSVGNGTAVTSSNTSSSGPNNNNGTSRSHLQVLSYQSTGSTAGGSDTATAVGVAGASSSFNNGSGSNNNCRQFRPMGYLTSQQRKHRMLLVSLLCAVLAVLTSLAVWRLRLALAMTTTGSTATTTTNDQQQLPTLSREEQRQQAKAALDRLNRQQQQQSSHVTIQEGCESTVLLMRHCDKLGPDEDDDDDESKHCSYVGFERAAFLPTLFGNTAATAAVNSERWPAPSRLYALTSSSGRVTHMNYREWETLLPLSKKTGVDIELVQENADKFASDHVWRHLQSGDLCGKVAVVCWRHSHIPILATALGCGPDNGCPGAFPEDSFDQVWQLKFVFRPPVIRPDTEQGDANQAAAKETAHRHRDMKHRKNRHPRPTDTSPPDWIVHASVTQQFFDPLAFSKGVGDYPDGGTATGGRWRVEL